jgi:hypothetical protein
MNSARAGDLGTAAGLQSFTPEAKGTLGPSLPEGT